MLFKLLQRFSRYRGWHLTRCNWQAMHNETMKELRETRKELNEYKEEPCPKNVLGHWFDRDGNCVYCGKYDEMNNLRLPKKPLTPEYAPGTLSSVQEITNEVPRYD